MWANCRIERSAGRGRRIETISGVKWPEHLSGFTQARAIPGVRVVRVSTRSVADILRCWSGFPLKQFPELIKVVADAEAVLCGSSSHFGRDQHRDCTLCLPLRPLPKDSLSLRVIECSCLMRLWRSKQEYHTGETFPARLTLP